MKVYYAHAMCTYGNPIERAESKRIRARFAGCRVVDPGEYEGNPEKKTKGMEYCCKLIRNCDVLVFSRLLKEITSGVGLEIGYALTNGIRVYELRGHHFKVIKKPPHYLSRESTIQLYRIWRMNEWRRQDAVALMMTPKEINQEVKEIKLGGTQAWRFSG
jgi:nucleoside 2-deoxyribosyltransferase